MTVARHRPASAWGAIVESRLDLPTGYMNLRRH
jgi:hypothetical protein